MTLHVGIEGLSSALVHTLRVMGVAVEEPGPVERGRGHDELADLSAHLLVAAGERLVVLLASDGPTARGLASAISGDVVAEDSELCGDTLGEILNVVVGSAEPRGAREFSIPIIEREPEHLLPLYGASVERATVHTSSGALRLYRVTHGF